MQRRHTDVASAAATVTTRALGLACSARRVGGCTGGAAGCNLLNENGHAKAEQTIASSQTVPASPDMALLVSPSHTHGQGIQRALNDYSFHPLLREAMGT
jgi:hypothetical protein